MTLKIAFQTAPAKTVLSGADVIVLFADKKKKADGIAALPAELKTFVEKRLSNAASFDGKAGQHLTLTPPGEKGPAYIVIAGTAKAERDDTAGRAHELLGGRLYPALATLKPKKVAVIAGSADAADIAVGLKLKSYDYSAYKHDKDKDKKKAAGFSVTLTCKDAAAAKKAFARLDAEAEGVALARDLVNMPPNDLYPESYAALMQGTLKKLGVEVTVLDSKKMEKLGFGAHLAVGKGSARPPCVVLLRWNGLGPTSSGSGKKAKPKTKPFVLVGKGVTFDTGGISLKPGAGMDEMKMDMGGSAAVAGAILALAKQKAKTHVVGVLGLAENMPAHNAYRPGDILTSYSGKTIEVLNTDAEGRLVLADCLSYIQKTEKPDTVIDLATLTGAMMVALGFEYSGVFANDESLWKKIDDASRAAGEKVWRMPLDSAYRKEVESDVADIKNLGGRFGGACSAAGFLEHFVEDGVKWAHFDIAGMAWLKNATPLGPKGASGYGVRLLTRLIQGS